MYTEPTGSIITVRNDFMASTPVKSSSTVAPDMTEDWDKELELQSSPSDKSLLTPPPLPSPLPSLLSPSVSTSRPNETQGSEAMVISSDESADADSSSSSDSLSDSGKLSHINVHSTKYYLHNYYYTTDPLHLELQVMQNDMRLAKLEELVMVLTEKVSRIENFISTFSHQQAHHTYLNQPATVQSPVSVVQTVPTTTLNQLPQQSPGTVPPLQQNTVHQPKKVKSTENALPSGAIDGTLSSAADVIARYPNLKESKLPTLAVKLAKEVFFGEKVMRQCTPLGGRNLPGLPTAELNQLKETLFQHCPRYWSNIADFETMWSSSIDAIGQACKRLRK